MADVARFLAFLQARLCADGQPILERLESAQEQGRGWHRLQFRDFETAALPAQSQAAGGWPAEWSRAWHGCKLEALYSILFHGRLLESCNPERGERFFSAAPGVYVHKDGTRHKADNYIRFVPIFGDGVFWAAKLEVWVDRTDRVVAPKKTDQWVQRGRSVVLAALWACGRTAEEMEAGAEVSDRWDPLLEANPFTFTAAISESDRLVL